MIATIAGNEGIVINKGSYHAYELMKEDYLYIEFESEALYAFKAGDTVKINGMSMPSGYHLIEDYAPSYNAVTGAYSYRMKFYAAWFNGSRKLVKINVGSTGEPAWQTVFTTTDLASNIATLIAASAGWTIKANVDPDFDKYVTLSFSGTKCIDALNMLVKALDENGWFEWWFDEGSKQLHIGKCKIAGNGAALELGSWNVASVNATGNMLPVAPSRIFAYGGTRNMSDRFGMAAPVLNAVDEEVVSIDTIPVTLYYDEAHPVTPDMFLKSRRIYPTLAKYEPKEKTTKQTATDYATRTFTYRLDRSVRVAGMSAIAKMQADAVVIDIDIKPKAGVTPTQPLEVTFKADVSLVRRINSATTEAVGKLGGAEWSQSELEKRIEIAKELRFMSNEADDYEIVVNVELAKPSQSASISQYTVEITVNDINLGCEITSESTYACDAGDGNRMNQFFLPLYDYRARLFSKTIEKKPMNEVGIPRGKIPYSWFAQDASGTAIATRIEKRLRYVWESKDNTNGEEMQIVFDEIYPRFGGTIGEDVGEWKTVEETFTNGEKTGRLLRYYAFETDLFESAMSAEDFTDDRMQIAFDKGASLGGMEFDVKVIDKDGGGVMIAVIPNENYTDLLPNDTLHPKAGDKYSLFGLNAAIYDEDGKATKAAQEDLAAATESYAQLVASNTGVYVCQMRAVDTNGAEVVTSNFMRMVGLGKPVRLTFGGVDITTRIMGVKWYLDLPQAGFELTIGDTMPYRRIDYIERRLN